MMELQEARAKAASLLAGVDSLGERLELAGDDYAKDLGWSWVFEWSTARWFATQDPTAVPPPGGGPIVVVKSTGDTWMLLSATPYDDQLAGYAERNGYQHTARLEEVVAVEGPTDGR